MSLLALALNLTGLAQWLDGVGIGGVITGTTGFMAAPISAGSRRLILRICATHLAVFSAICALIQGILFLLPAVDPATRWAVLFYCLLPPSYLTPGLGRTADDAALASGVCTILTVSCLAIFCLAAVMIA